MFRDIDCRTHKPIQELRRVIEGPFPRLEMPTIVESIGAMKSSTPRNWLTIKPGDSPFDPTVVVELIEGIPHEYNPLSNGGGGFILSRWMELSRNSSKNMRHYHLDMNPRLKGKGEDNLKRGILHTLSELNTHQSFFKRLDQEMMTTLVEEIYANIFKTLSSGDLVGCHVGSDGLQMALAGNPMLFVTREGIDANPHLFGSEKLPDTQGKLRGIVRTKLTGENQFIEVEGGGIGSNVSPITLKFTVGLAFGELNYRGIVTTLERMVEKGRPLESDLREIIDPYISFNLT